MSKTPPKRILLIRPSALGDVCRSVPLVVSLKAHWPESKIDWLVQDDFKDVISMHPAIDEVISFPRNAMRRWYLPRGFARTLSFLRVLKSKQYDLVIDAQGLGRSGLFAWATRARQRIGPVSAREFGWLGYTQKIQTTKEHTVDQMLELISAIGASPMRDMQLYLHEQDKSWWKSYKDSHEIQSYVVLAPTSRWKSKQWPVDRFISIAKHMHGLGKSIVVVGAPNEAKQIQSLCEYEGIHNLLPEMTIGRLMAVLEGSNLVIANDSSALHIAVGLQKPIIGLFGPTNPAQVGPYKRDDEVISADINYAKVHYRDSALGSSIMEKIEVKSVLHSIDAFETAETSMDS